MITKAHLRIAHDIGEQIMVSNFTEQQRRILDFILRLSWGCGKETAIIPNQSIFEVIGVRRQHIKSHLDWLETSEVIQRTDQIYSIKRDFSQWRITRAFGYRPEKIKSLVRINLKYRNGNVTEFVTTEYNEMLRNLLQRDIKHVTKNVTKSEKHVTKFVTHQPKDVTKYVTSPDTNLATAKESIYINNIYIKKESKERKVYGEFQNVLLSEKQFDDLMKKFGEKSTLEKIEELSIGIASKGYKFKNFYATILSWDRRERRRKPNEKIKRGDIPDYSNYQPS